MALIWLSAVQSLRWLSSLQDRDIELLELMEQHRQLQVISLAKSSMSQHQLKTTHLTSSVAPPYLAAIIGLGH